MLKKILIVLLVVVTIFVIIVALQPSEFRYSRSATINAPAAIVFENINDLHKWQAWSPWAKMDPNAKINYEGPTSGIGAIFGWAGNKHVGEGKMTITESKATDLILIKLDFIKPFESSNTTEFTFKTVGNQTLVTWSMFGKNNFMAKGFGLFVNCDKMLGDEFEKGFANLKGVVETTNKN